MLNLATLVVTLASSYLQSQADVPETMEDVLDVPVLSPVSLSEGLVVTVLKRPERCLRVATPGDKLKVHYTGRFDDGEGEVFDTSLKSGHPPYSFQLGAGRVILGYERGVPGMCKGEVRTLSVPPGLAYGEHGVPGKIPGNSRLHFTVELLSIEDGVLPPPPAPPRQKVTTETSFLIIFDLF